MDKFNKFIWKKTGKKLTGKHLNQISNTIRKKNGIPIKFIASKAGNKKTKIHFYTHNPGKGGWSEWVYPTKKYLFKCCDCGLVHELEFGTMITKNKKGIEFEVVKLPEEIRAMFRARRYKSN